MIYVLGVSFGFGEASMTSDVHRHPLHERAGRFCSTRGCYQLGFSTLARLENYKGEHLCNKCKTSSYYLVLWSQRAPDFAEHQSMASFIPPLTSIAVGWAYIVSALLHASVRFSKHCDFPYAGCTSSDH